MKLLSDEQWELLSTYIKNSQSTIEQIFTDKSSQDKEIIRQYTAILNSIGEIRTEFNTIRGALSSVPRRFESEADKVVEATASALEEVTEALDSKPIHVIKKEIGFFKTIFRRKNAKHTY
ncbi:MAG: hypothetical protein ACRDFB_03130 [Rhabdochlamydiaceae bacterium]